jgi:hypothetical protein
MKRLVQSISAKPFFFFNGDVSIQGEEVVSLHCNSVLMTSHIVVVLVCR